MEEILALQQQLADVQQSSTAHRLSDRNCVELVMKLQSLKLIELIFTRSGKEYLTPHQLTLEIQDEILTRGGRVNLTDLPDALNVELSYIEKALPEITTDPAIRLIRGEIITDYYLTSLIDQLNDTLSSSESGIDSLAAIASRYSLPVDLIRETFQRYENRLIAQFDSASGQLTSSAAVARQRASARGMLRALTSPAQFSDISDHGKLPLQTIADVAEEMVNSAQLRGVIEGRVARAVFVPKVFTDAAQLAILSEFSTNGYVTMDIFSRMHISSVDEFIGAHFIDAERFEHSVVGPVLLDTLQTSATEAIANSNWLDVIASLPPSFPESDARRVVQALAYRLEKDLKTLRQGNDTAQTRETTSVRGKRKGRPAQVSKEASRDSVFVVGEKFIVSPELLQSFRSSVEKDAVKKAESRAKMVAARSNVVGKKPEFPEAFEYEPSQVTEKKKGKGRRRAGGIDKSTRTSTTGSSTDTELRIECPSAEEVAEIILGNEECSAAIESDYLESSDDGEEMLRCAVQKLFGDSGVQDLYLSKAAEAVESLEKERALAKQKAEMELLESLRKAEVFFKSAETLPSAELADISKNWIQDTECVNAVCRMINIAAHNTGVVHPQLAQAHELASKKEKLETARDAASKFAPSLESKTRELVNIAVGKNDETVSEFLASYDAAIDLLDLPERRPANKKSEKATFMETRAELCSKLDEGPSLPSLEILRIAAILVHAKSNAGAIVMFSVDDALTFSTVIKANSKPSEAGVALGALHDAVVSSYANEGESAERLFEDVLERLRTVREYTG